MLVSREAGAALVLADGGVQHRDGFGEGDGDVVVGGGLAGGPGGFAFEFDEPFGGGVRLGRLEPGGMVGEGGVAAPGPAELSARTRVDLPVHRVVGPAFDDLAACEAEGLDSGSPPAAGWFAGLGGAEVVPAGGAFGGVVLGFPDVAEVVALGDGDDYGQYGGLLSRGGDAAAGLPMIISVNATVCVIGTRVSDQRFMIICSEEGRRVPEGEKGEVSRRKENIKVDTESAGSCRGSSWAAGALRGRRYGN